MRALRSWLATSAAVLLGELLLSCGGAGGTDASDLGGTTGPIAATPIASIVVSPATLGLQVGESGALAGTPYSATGTALPDRALTWTVGDTALAVISPSGVVSAKRVGTTTISATAGTIVGSATLTITPVPAASLTLTLAASSLTVGQTTTAQAVVRDAIGNVLTGRAVVFTSSNPQVASVQASGVVTAASAGAATIKATSEGKEASALLNVMGPAFTLLARPVAGPLVPGSILLLTARGAPILTEVDYPIRIGTIELQARGTSDSTAITVVPTTFAAGVYAVTLTVAQREGRVNVDVSAPSAGPATAASVRRGLDSLANLVRALQADAIAKPSGVDPEGRRADLNRIAEAVASAMAQFNGSPPDVQQQIAAFLAANDPALVAPGGVPNRTSLIRLRPTPSMLGVASTQQAIDCESGLATPEECLYDTDPLMRRLALRLAPYAYLVAAALLLGPNLPVKLGAAAIIAARAGLELYRTNTEAENRLFRDMLFGSFESQPGSNQLMVRSLLVRRAPATKSTIGGVASGALQLAYADGVAQTFPVSGVYRTISAGDATGPAGSVVRAVAEFGAAWNSLAGLLGGLVRESAVRISDVPSLRVTRPIHASYLQLAGVQTPDVDAQASALGPDWRLTFSASKPYTGSIPVDFTVKYTGPATTPPTKSFTITLSAPAQLKINPGNGTIRAGSSVDYVASATDPSGSATTLPAVRWTSDNPSVATVDGQGRVRALSEGIARLKVEVADPASTPVRYTPGTATVDVVGPASGYWTWTESEQFFVPNTPTFSCVTTLQWLVVQRSGSLRSIGGHRFLTTTCGWTPPPLGYYALVGSLSGSSASLSWNAGKCATWIGTVTSSSGSASLGPCMDQGATIVGTATATIAPVPGGFFDQAETSP